MGTFIIVNEYLENLKSLYDEFKTAQTNLKEVEIIPNVQELLENRYFVNLFNGKEIKYEQLCRRVARVIAATEINHAHANTDIEMDDNDLLLTQIRNIENSIYTDMINGNFLFNSPCLFSAGTGFSATENGHLLYDDEITLDDYRKIYENSHNKNQMLFACFVIGIEDSIEGIFDAVKKCAIISKAGGGVGLNFSPLREKNAKIRDNEGLASGVVSFAGDFNAMGDSIRQGGKRRVALMGMLNSNHPDIEEFINCKTEEGKLTNFNISVAIDDKFMEAIQNDSDYDLISSVDGHIVKTIKARELWNNICESAHRRGDPGIFFIDLTNKDSLLKNDEDYYINSTNPCSTGDTLVATPNGWKRADSFNVDDEIITVDGVEKIQDIEINNDIDVYQVDFADGGSVKVTPSHQFMWVNKQNSNITEFRQLKDLQVGDYIKICPSSIPDNHTINTFGLSEFDYGLILGALFGDGCVTETAIKASSVRVSFGRQDTQWQQYFENVLTKYNIQYHVNEKRTAFDVVFNKGTVIYDIIDNINLTGYSYNKRIPINIVNSNKEILSGLLNGYFSTDGNVNLGSTRPQIRLTSCNLELLQDVRLILLMFGISCTVHTVVRDHSIIEGRLVNSRNKYTLIINSISLITFLNEIGLNHQEKLNKLNSCFENYKPMNHRWRTTIKNITYIGKEKVYDLHAPKSDTWLTNGYVSRGCGEANLPNFTSCNLGSINLANFVTTNNNKFDFDEFIKMVRRGIYYLDLVIDTSAYPLTEIEERTKNIRPVGLGLMGLADMFIKLGIKYGSEESNKLSEQIAQIMAAQSLYESVKLAEIKGSFEQFDKEPQQKLLLTMYNEMVINYGIESANNNIAIQYIKDIIDGNIKSILPISIANAFYSLYQYNKEDFYKIFHKFEDGYLRNSRRLSVAPTGCQVKDTMVVTNKGILKLDEIGNIDNTEQWSDLSNFNICQEKDNVPATKFYINGYKPTKKIKTRDGLILECTYNHKYRIFDNNGNYVWKQADELNIGDKIVYRIGGYTKQTNPSLELPYKEYRTRKKVTFPVFMNEDLAFFVGAYTGNGSLHDKGATMRIDVNMEKEEVNQRIIDVIKRLFDIDIKRIEPKKGSKGGVISIYSVEVTDKLSRLGLLKKRSITATIPRLIRESSVSCIKAFIDGLFITDGYKDRHMRKITTASWQLASELLIVLRAIGINGKIQFRNDKYHDKTYYTVVFDIYGSEDFKNEQWVLSQFRRNHDELLSIADNLYTSEIVEITDSENDTYDIEVPENNTYLANSYISHNTISMILNTSSSLEPNFAFEWKRNITNSNGTVETKIFKHKYADVENKELLVTANELTPDEHVNIVKAFAPYIDASISKCVAKGTKIYTNKGFINIEDFGNPDKEIDTFEDISDKNIYIRDMFGHWKKVLSHYRGGMKDTYIITFKDGFSIECSSTHKFECRDIITRYTGNHNPYSEVVSIWLSASNLYEDFRNHKKIEIEYISIDKNERITQNPSIRIIKSAYNSNDNSGELRCISYIREIQNITKSTNEVYDIEVEDTHTYLIDGVISHNTVNMPNNATVEDVKKVYENCYNNGIKGITIYRDMSREGQTLQKIDNNKLENKQDNKQDTSTIVNNIERPKVITGFTQKGETNYGNLYATLNVVDGKPYELFVNIGKSGSLAKSLSEALSRTISISLQNGINIDEIIKTLNGIADSETPWVFEDYKGNEEWCKSIPDMIAKMMKSLSEYVKEIGAVEQNIIIKNVDNTANEQNIDMNSIIEHDKCSTDKKKILCPECLKNGNEIFLVQLAGCPTCPSCGWSACA